MANPTGDRIVSGFEFENDKQKEAARIMLKRCSGNSAPNKMQLSNLVIKKSGYKTDSTAVQFVKDFIADSSTPLEAKGEKVIRTDIKKEVVM